MNKRGRDEGFTDFSSRFTRSLFYPPVVWRDGGLFSVKVAAGREIQTNHYPWQRPKPYILYFLERLRSNKSQTET